MKSIEEQTGQYPDFRNRWSPESVEVFLKALIQAAQDDTKEEERK